jgi:hypothetical protein
MAAGLGFKTFAVGEILSAANVNGYLMQGVLVFANATARDAAITSPQEGQFAFTKDNDSLWYYSGSAWVASGATGDIEGVTAGTGISGGGTSGTVTITNSMATEITAKGDLIVGTGNAAFDNLAVGTNGHILTADSSVSPTGLKWAAPAGGGGMTLIASGSLSGSSLSLDVSGEQSYNDLILDITGAVWSANANVGIRVNAITSAYGYVYYGNSGNTATNQATGAGESYWIAGDGGALPSASDTFKRYRFIFPMYSLTSGTLQMFGYYSWGNENSTNSNAIIIGSQETADNIDTIIFRTNGGQTFSAGTYKLWGVK